MGQSNEQSSNQSENITISNIDNGLQDAIMQSDIMEDAQPAEDAIEQGSEAESSLLAEGMLSCEQFTEAFISAFNITSGLTKLQSLAIRKDDQQVKVCAGAIYDYATEVPQLRFLIEPSNVHIQRALAIVPFAYFKFAMVKAELKERKAKDVEVEESEVELNAEE